MKVSNREAFITGLVETRSKSHAGSERGREGPQACMQREPMESVRSQRECPTETTAHLGVGFVMRTKLTGRAKCIWKYRYIQIHIDTGVMAIGIYIQKREETM